MSFKFIPLNLSEVILIEPDTFFDDRGFFAETFKKSDFLKNGLPVDFVQDSVSCSKKNVLRGLHFQQAPYAQGKLVHVLAGSIYDVAVDIREDSSTFGHWVAAELSATNRKMLWIPPGFAHGMLALEENTVLHYKISGAEYMPNSEGSLRWDDSEINIDWPIERDEVIISDKDKDAISLIAFKSIELKA